MMRSKIRTQTITCDGLPIQETPEFQETAFEKQRGVSRLEQRDGFCQVHVTELGHPLMERRLEVLTGVAESGISIDFMKLTPGGLSFVVPQRDRASIEATLKAARVQHSLRSDRSIVLVHAVNMRDEEGLIAGIVQSAIASGAQIDHIGDGHDRLLLFAGTESVAKIVQHFRHLRGPNGKREGRARKSA